ncbi:transposase family protein [Duganella qianjiadongensis]|uniref:transposase family protein n=1 Tax=Duganella qianjiadongensis TaxID=2692176 RepID=UPI001E556F39|nr:transposase family protein [Duganella qianjiadongensis]
MATRELLGWHLSRSGKAKTAEAALEQALIARYGTLGKVTAPFLLRLDNGLVFTSRSYTKLVRSYPARRTFRSYKSCMEGIVIPRSPFSRKRG